MRGDARRDAPGRWFWRFVGWLAGAGSIWIAAEWWSVTQQGPPEGHPERLRTDVPLTPAERALRRGLPRELRRATGPFL
ncbi:hypothetical protein KMT30_35230 [Streptomyces sp. IBSBF 2953]|uniref:DUF6059 family protein n=1 Tax=Streptomyces TaxID=1883 RepID=UPI002119DBB2|nr:DUF6059 family protein [Streptomyces scabiei]MCQ9184204.1 hypothetical protein [Streptomyces hayashii]MDX3117938.1 hypothetical protein [Streptomyces scabiei]